MTFGIKLATVSKRVIQQWTPNVPIFSGVALTTILAAAVYFLNSRSVFNALGKTSLAILLGIIITNSINIPESFNPGIKFTLKKILNLAIILLGLRLSIADVFTIGPIGFLIILTSLVSTFYVTYWLGRLLGLNPKFVQLIAAGTSICGTSAIVATNGVINASEEEVTHAAIIVTAIGTLAMAVYPFIANLLHLTSQHFGLWCGISIQQTAQVVAAAFQKDLVSGEFATLSKLSRVMFLIPTMLTLGFFSTQKRNIENTIEHAEGVSKKRPNFPIPWFIAFFFGVVVLNSMGIIPDAIRTTLVSLNEFLLIMVMVAVGLTTNLSTLWKTGLKPLYLGLTAWLHLSLISLGLIKLLV
ncbi:MAG: YeiH family protein [Cyanobacteria bacterium P01_F01_bin.150]